MRERQLTPEQVLENLSVKIDRRIEESTRRMRKQLVQNSRNIDNNADLINQCDHEMARQTDLAYLTHLRLNKQEVAAALARVRRGEYGNCEECWEQIPPKRLAQMPTAQYCVQCQEALESNRPATIPGAAAVNVGENQLFVG